MTGPRVPPGLVIFDCDGVLVDSEPISNALLAEALGQLGLTLSMAETSRIFVGLSWPDCIRKIELLTGRPVPGGWEADLRARELEVFRHRLRPVSGVRRVIHRLQVKNVPFCVASSGGIDKMRLTLGVTDLLPEFEHVLFSAQMVARGKPHPDLFLHAAREMGETPDRCTVIEDSAHGVTAGRAAGMRVLAYAADPDCDRDALRAAGGEVFMHMHEVPPLLGL